MQEHAIWLVRDGGKHATLARPGVGQQTQRLVTVAGQHHLVERSALTIVEHQFDAVVPALHPGHRTRHPCAFAKVRDQPVHVGAGPAVDGQPLRSTGELDQTVVGEEAQKALCREACDARLRARPDRRRHRVQVTRTEGVVEAVSIEESSDGQACVHGL